MSKAVDTNYPAYGGGEECRELLAELFGTLTYPLIPHPEHYTRLCARLWTLSSGELTNSMKFGSHRLVEIFLYHYLRCFRVFIRKLTTVGMFRTSRGPKLKAHPDAYPPEVNLSF